MKRFKEVIKLAAKIREESYDYEEANRLEESQVYCKDFNKCYKKSLWEAANEAAEALGFDTQANQPIYLLLTYTWNDILAWAEESK